jgi:NCS1 family nucleobase:cation symporter-1
VVFGILTIAVFSLGFPDGAFDLGDFKATPFLIQFGAVAGYQISWACGPALE